MGTRTTDGSASGGSEVGGEGAPARGGVKSPGASRGPEVGVSRLLELLPPASKNRLLNGLGFFVCESMSY